MNNENEQKDSIKNNYIFILSKEEKNKFDNYKIEEYILDIKKDGIQKTWDNICCYILQYGERNSIIKVSNFGEMYEIGLATEDKTKKKNNGQYFTPDDVALVMSEWLEKSDGSNVCDVACGTGNLILTYLDFIGKEKALKLLREGKIYLYDYDEIALKICKTSLLIKYGIGLFEKIHDICGDFLDDKIVLPKDCKTISNPPYVAISKIGENWNVTDVIKDTHEWYAAFMEKIFEQSKSTVIITPFSFVSGNKFYSLRRKMCEIGNGFIVVFDNVPGNIFCGRKHGIFNSNTSNSVRAAITVLSSSDTKKGFRVSPMIRFKNEERKELLKCEVLEATINEEIQLIDENNVAFKKIMEPLDKVYKSWGSKSSCTVGDLIGTKNKFLIDIPNTCRYNTTASAKKLSRSGSITLYGKGEDEYYFLYCFINSSFAYWWWRIYDGGITYPKGLLYKLPIPFNLLDDNEKKEFKEIALEMISKENDFISTKMNAGAVQENIKFPEEYKNLINKKILKILECNEDESVFNQIHSNRFFIDEDGINGKNNFKW